MNLRYASLALLSATAGCVGSVDTLGVGGEPSVEFVSPSASETTLRDVLDENGSRIAAVDVRLKVGGITQLELRVRGERIALEDVSERDVQIAANVIASGNVDIEANGLDAGGQVVASATVSTTIADPDLDCAGWMGLFGVDYEVAPATDGIPEPIVASLPIGVPYRYVASESQRETLLADCSLIRALAESSGLLKERGVTEVADIGVYNYRCIGGGSPPDCPNGISQHAYAKAIDIAGYTTDEGYFSVNDDWVIDGDDEDACTAATVNEKDSFLHEIICAQKARGVWNIVLTPNYNAAHRDHFHVDLTSGSDFLNRHAGGDAH